MILDQCVLNLNIFEIINTLWNFVQKYTNIGHTEQRKFQISWKRTDHLQNGLAITGLHLHMQIISREGQR